METAWLDSHYFGTNLGRVAPLHFPGACRYSFLSRFLWKQPPSLSLSGLVTKEETEETGLVIPLLFRVRMSFEIRTLGFLGFFFATFVNFAILLLSDCVLFIIKDLGAARVLWIL